MSAIKRAALVIYGVYAWAAFAILASTTLIFLLLAPTLQLRRLIARIGARAWLFVAGIRIEYVGRARLPETPVVVVANHSSYLDGVLLKALLPSRFAFVIKKEMVRVPLAGLLLRRLGAEFVDRFNRHSGAMDTRRLLRAASGGGSLVFFPEGTFTTETGLGRFHGGAFAIAARARLPVVPLAIAGARNILGGGSMLPRAGRVRVEVLPAIDAPAMNDANEIADYQRERSREALLRALDEPDLAHDGVAALAARKKT